MSQQQLTELDRAILRAARRGIAIAGHGTRKRDGASVFLVSSGSQPGENHWVVVSGGRLVCDCPARVMCVHRAVVHERVAALAASRQVEIRHVAVSIAQRRDTAPPARDDKPFSIWK